MKIRMDGKKEIVKEDGKGIGKESEMEFEEEGEKVYEKEINEDEIEKMEGIEGIVKRRMEVMEEDEVKEMVDEIGKIDIILK